MLLISWQNSCTKSPYKTEHMTSSSYDTIDNVSIFNKVQKKKNGAINIDECVDKGIWRKLQCTLTDSIMYICIVSILNMLIILYCKCNLLNVHFNIITI